MTAQILVLGTRNRKKGIELADVLAPVGLEIRTLADYPDAIEVEEDGQTFAENAAKKATQQAVKLGQWVLGEDSGLVVDALDGAPGVYSARYSDPGATDERNNEKLIRELANVPWEKRTAHYVCTAAVSDPAGQVRATSEGRCHGYIRFEPAGTGGFGYDPYFEILEYHATFGELGPAVKRCLSHRGRAIRALIPDLIALKADIR